MKKLTLVVTAIAAIFEAELPVQQIELPAVAGRHPLSWSSFDKKMSWRRRILDFENE
jgi:hypothetical protein